MSERLRISGSERPDRAGCWSRSNCPHCDASASLQVISDHFIPRPIAVNTAASHQEMCGTQFLDRGHVVTYEQHGPAPPRDLTHLPHAFGLKRHRRRRGPRRQRGSRVRVGGNREREADVHPARVALDGRVEELAHPRERDDLVEAAADLPRRIPRMRRSGNVLASGEFGMESRADLESRRPARGAPLVRWLARDPGSTFRIVDFPAPLAPTKPTTSPERILTSRRTAQRSAVVEARRGPRARVASRPAVVRDALRRAAVVPAGSLRPTL